ncbi:MAG: M15 family peptidase [Desulfurellales bacterium]|nr:MAG: M15 family peptidase [Desulfurellales bacterium]
MTLGQKQRLFARLLPRLLDKVFELGLEYTVGDAYRDPRVHGAMGVRKSYSHPRSAHKLRLAIDLNLFRGADFLEQTADHEQLGTWWEQQHPLCRWGGRFDDGNHYSIEHDGVK